MAITLVQSKTVTGSGTSRTVTFDSPITAGNRLVLIAASYASTTVTGSVGNDSLGNTFTPDPDGFSAVSSGSSGSTDNKRLEMFSAVINTGGTCTITYTVTASAIGISLVAQEWSGLFAGLAYGGGPGAGWIDRGIALGAGTPPPLTMNFAADFPDQAAYYGTTLPLVAISAGFNSTLSVNTQSFPNADRSVTITWPSTAFGVTAVFLVILYVGPVTPPSITCGSPPTGMDNIPYSHSFPASGGAAPYTWILASGSLPPGLTLNALTGVVSGTPTTAGTYGFGLKMIDGHGVAVTLSCSIQILPAPVFGSLILDLWVWRELFRFTSLDQDLNFPPGYAKALIFALACELYLEYPAAESKYDYAELEADAATAVADLELLNASDAISEEPAV